jgi:hypothetical protein
MKVLLVASCLMLGALGGLAVPTARSVATAASPTTCAPVYSTRTKLITPTLQQVRIGNGLGTCPQGIRVTSRGPRGALWGTDTQNGIWKSTDDLRTWRLLYRTPAPYKYVERVLELRSGTVLIVAYDQRGRRFVLRSHDGGRSFSGPVLSLPLLPGDDPGSASRLLNSQSWLQLGSSVFMGEYHSGALRPVHLWRSDDDGRTFQNASVFTGVRHIHGVYRDPYDPRRLWVAIGDTELQPRIGYSTDRGATFTFVTEGKYPESRAVGLMFTRKAMFWATDSPEVPAQLFRWDRATGEVTSVLGGLNGPFYYTVRYKGAQVQLSTVSLKSDDGYIGDEFVHVLTTGDDGASWKSARTPWRRSRVQPPRKASIIGITDPDKSGRFWVSFYNLEGSNDRSTWTTNLELRLIPSAR